ncbi:MAG TPA: hypothetical protein VJT49_06170 [Amycolatopsis sp.]|uniref:hypothetical protein n=1 Tax=Amycolatopsis sp. TaxID=37632 RepID=UPI002B4988AA|nr:hypothetical protein [Amycolatopsis sp.]HKS44692.1 hypothetical protein [Amycolatopsis sp.]
MRATFLPLTTDAAAKTGAHTVLRRAAEAEAAANACWASLLGGCASAKRWGLDTRLRQLSQATRDLAGTRWWFTEGTGYRRRVAHAQGCIEEAIIEGDGSEFARAFAGYDHAMATVVVAARNQRHGTVHTRPAKNQ